jgi:para-aminobenzoate synthetase component I
MLDWASRSGIFLLLDNNQYALPHGRYECLLAAGVAIAECHTLQQLEDLHRQQQDWLFGHIAYDYKNELEPKLRSVHSANLGFPQFYFFIPETVCYIDRACTSLTITSIADPAQIHRDIMHTQPLQQALPWLSFSSRVARDHYMDNLEHLREHIAAGDCYEINYCCERYCENVMLEPIAAFCALNHLSPAPFAACYKLGDRYAMSASPERYLQKIGTKILSQPMKGTAGRGTDAQQDEAIKNALHNDVKERAENVMITDLVRNDLARTCKAGSVEVEELFGIYTFPQVHQMVSTVSGRLRDDACFTDSIRLSFPMGSMTGAPKHKVMQLIDQYEQSRRELYSGAIGYIDPRGDFDFNVMIRSLFYNAATQYLSFHTGGAITYDSIAGKEWEEIRLKAWALERLFI